MLQTNSAAMFWLKDVPFTGACSVHLTAKLESTAFSTIAASFWHTNITWSTVDADM